MKKVLPFVFIAIFSVSISIIAEGLPGEPTPLQEFKQAKEDIESKNSGPQASTTTQTPTDSNATKAADSGPQEQVRKIMENAKRIQSERRLAEQNQNNMPNQSEAAKTNPSVENGMVANLPPDMDAQALDQVHKMMLAAKHTENEQRLAAQNRDKQLIDSNVPNTLEEQYLVNAATNNNAATKNINTSNISTAPTVNNANVIPTANIAATTEVNSANNKQLAEEVEQINQLNLLFEQKITQQIQRIAEENEALQSRVTQLSQTLSVLMTRVTELSGQLSKLTTDQAQYNQWFNNFIAFLNRVMLNAADNQINLIIYSILSLLFIFFTWILFRGGKKKSVASKKINPEKKPIEPSIHSTADSNPQVTKNRLLENDDYEFIGSIEGIPAQIDLARTYLEMGDYESATETLNYVIEHGNDEQIEIAKELLNEIPMIA